MDNFLVFLAAFLFLFLLPGLGLSWWLYPREKLDLLDRVPLGFGLALALFMVPFLVPTILALTWDAVRLIWIVLCFLMLAGGVTSWRRARTGRPKENGLSSGSAGKLLAVFLLLLACSAVVTLYTQRDEDDWSYYAVVRAFADASRFTPPTPTALRAGLSLWWFFHAFLLRTVDMDIVRLGRDYLPLVLVPLSILSFYFLANTLFGDKRRALLASCLQIGLYFLDLFQNNPDVQLTGGWVLGRIDQDHTAAQFIMLPVYAALMIRYLRGGGVRWLAGCFGALLALTLVHPQGFVQAGIITVPFLLLHLIVERRQAEWKRAALTLAPFVLVLLLLVPYILYWHAFTVSANVFDLSTLVQGQVTFPFLFRWVMFLSPNQFILRPDLLGQPILLAALLLTPGLFPLLRQGLPAQYLLALMVALVLILYNPIILPLLSEWMGWSIYRLWYLFPSALVIAFLGPDILILARASISHLRNHRAAWDARNAALLSVGLVLVASRFPLTIGIASAELSPTHTPSSESLELLTQLRQRVSASSVGGAVLAPREISDAIPSYDVSLSPVLFRYNVSRDRVYDATAFYGDPLVTASDVEILVKYQVAYLILPTNLESASQFDLLPSYFERIFRNREWALYRVSNPSAGDPLIAANTAFLYGEWQGAIDQYNRLASDETSTDAERSLAHTGLGMLLDLSGLTRKAVAELEQAVQIEPENAQAHFHLAGLYRKLGMEEEAALHARAAGPLVREVVNSPSER